MASSTAHQSQCKRLVLTTPKRGRLRCVRKSASIKDKKKHGEYSEVHRTCVECGKVIPSNNLRKKYCSFSCKTKYLNRKNNYRYRGKKKNCVVCGKAFYTTRNGNVCSPKCKAEARSKKIFRRRYSVVVAHIKLCKTKKEMSLRFPSDALFAIKHKITEYFLLKNSPNNVPHISDAEIISVAKRYKTKKDFRRKAPNMYNLARRRGLYESFSWLESAANFYSGNNFVYRYYFEEQNAVYVGRTINPKGRDWDHRSGTHVSSVCAFATKCGIEIPKMEILASGLSAIGSQEMEHQYVLQYRENGMVVLNKAKTGAGIGAMGAIGKKYTKEHFLQTAKRYQTAHAFNKEHPKLYIAAYVHGWLKDFSFPKRYKRSLSKAYCIAKAKEYPSPGTLKKGDSSVYSYLQKTGLLNDLQKEGFLIQGEGYKKRRKLTCDFCMSIARRYTTKVSFMRGDKSIYLKMLKHRWLNDCKWFVSQPKGGNRKKVKCLTLGGEFVCMYTSASEAERVLGIGSSQVSHVCRGEKKTAGGFRWEYA